MCHIMKQALGHHCLFTNTLMSPIILVWQEQSLILVNMYMSDSVNQDKVVHKYLLLIFNLLLKLLSMHL